MPDMFGPETPRLFGTPPGEDFCRAFTEGLIARAPDDPFVLARTTIYVNTRRTGRRMIELMSASGAQLLPRILPVSELSLTESLGLPPPVPGLRRRLQLTQVIRALLDKQPELAPRAAAYDLADSLAELMDEMADEAVEPETLIGQDFGELSEHWARSAEFLALIARYFGPDSAAERTAAGRLAEVVGALSKRWADTPPTDPVIVAGSTGSRGSTHALMRSIARLPQGAVVLPGFDFDLPPTVWEVISKSAAEDHPQYRFARLCQTLDVVAGSVEPWVQSASGRPRNLLMSLALRPAPVSDQWVVEGPALGPLGPATEGLSLIEAPSQRIEALAIALALRDAIGRGETAAVVTPDRRLTRTIAAELDRWGLIPDDSAGEPLAQSTAGRLLRLTAEALVEMPAADALLTLLKHPQVHSGPDRPRHLAFTRSLELQLRSDRHPYPGAEALRRAAPEGAEAWTEWLIGALEQNRGPMALADHVRNHVAMTELLAAGPAGGGSPWSGPDGAEARRTMATLEREAEHGGWLTATEYRDLVQAMLAKGEVRQAQTGHPQLKIWGTIEARVQGADLVVLAGLNEGTWPAHPAPDPWMNRPMRKTVGLTSPERRIGLSAHDFQQAVSGGRVILSRALRVDGAETVPARWLQRLTNLLDGLNEGKPVLAAMRARGTGLVALSERLDRRAEHVGPSPRPAPCPPVEARPRRLSVTEIQTLIRDPYAIYARHILGLRRLDPLRPEPDLPLQGTLLHDLLERFIRDSRTDPAQLTSTHLAALADALFERSIPWPGIRRIWRAKVAGFADWLVATETARRAFATPVALEQKERLRLDDPPFLLTGKPDRIDRLADGSLEIIDYKSGKLPAKQTVELFDRQLMLLAMMAEAGAFPDLGTARVSKVTHYGLGEGKVRETEVTPEQVSETARQLASLLQDYLRPSKGYMSKRMFERDRFEGDFDHLARLGEWSAADWPVPEQVE